MTPSTPSIKAKDLVEPFIGKLNVAILYPLISLLIGIALLMFLWGVFVYMKNADNDEARKTGQRHMLFGIIGLVIMVSAFAILSVAAETFGLSASNP